MTSRAIKPAALGSGRIAAKSAPLVPSCLDPSSGLYHLQHFRLSLAYEINRMYRADKPLGLVVIKIPAAESISIKSVASFLRRALRPLDTPAKIGDRELAALLPEADRDQATRLISALAEKFGDGAPTGATISYGGALARPWEEWTPAKLLSKARSSMDSASVIIARMLGGARPWAEVDTALAAAEKDSLFDGFSILAGQIGVRSGRN